MDEEGLPDEEVKRPQRIYIDRIHRSVNKEKTSFAYLRSGLNRTQTVCLVTLLWVRQRDLMYDWPKYAYCVCLKVLYNTGQRKAGLLIVWGDSSVFNSQTQSESLSSQPRNVCLQPPWHRSVSFTSSSRPKMLSIKCFRFFTRDVSRQPRLVKNATRPAHRLWESDTITGCV